MKYILVLDQGTTSTRAIIYDQKAKVIASAQEEFKQIYPKPGYVEHDPIDILSSARSVISTAITRAKIKYSELLTMGITNQRETVILWNKETGEPVYNAIVWQCRRSIDYCKNLINNGYEEMIKAKTGLKIDPYFSATKIKWIFENVSMARKLAKEGNLAIGTIDTYLLWSLSGGKIYKTDYTNASRTMLFNIYDLKWDTDLCNLFGIDISLLPEVCPSSHFFGYTSEDVLGCKIPINGVAGDQQSALFGQLCLKSGELKVTYGTGCFLLMNTGNMAINSSNGLLTTLACMQNNKPIYAIEGSVFVAGALIQWLRDELEIIKNASETEEIAKSVKDANGVYIVPAFVGLGAPYWDSQAEGIITGLTRGANKKHIVRAALEAIAYEVYDLVKTMEEENNAEIKAIKVDGGACVNNFLMQFQADILNKYLLRPTSIEVTALGACYLAGLNVGLWNEKDLEKLAIIDQEFKPNMSYEERNKLINGWHKAIEKSILK